MAQSATRVSLYRYVFDQNHLCKNSVIEKFLQMMIPWQVCWYSVVPTSNTVEYQIPYSALDLIPILKVRFVFIATVLVKYMISKPSFSTRFVLYESGKIVNM